MSGDLRAAMAGRIGYDEPLIDDLLALPEMAAYLRVGEAALGIHRLKPGTVEHNKAWADFVAAVAELDALETGA